VHLVRHSLNFCFWKDRKVQLSENSPLDWFLILLTLEGCTVREAYSADTAEAAQDALEAFDAKRARQYSSSAQPWRRAWEEVTPFFGFDPAIRKIIYTTNAIESLNRVIRKSIKTRGSFPTNEAATKLIYLAICSFETTAETFGNGLPPAISSPKCSANASTRECLKPHGPERIHKVQDTPRSLKKSMTEAEESRE
jgi:hypothetical protein